MAKRQSHRFKEGERVWWRSGPDVQKQVVVLADIGGLSVHIQDGNYDDDGLPRHLNVSRHQLTRQRNPHLEDRTRPERDPFA